MLKHKMLWCFALLLTLAIGCSKHNSKEANIPEQPGEDPVLQMILREGYLPSEIVEHDDHYVVQGDIIFSKKGHAPANGAPNTEQARSTFLVSTSNRNISVYLNAGSFSSINLNTIVDNVIAAFNAVGSGITMNRVFSAGSADITIVQNSGIGTNVCGQAGFPFSSGQPFNTVYISESTLITHGLTSTGQLTELVAHELGHCVGLRHTNWQPRGESAAIHIPSTPSSDGASVMNGGSCGVSWDGFSFYDQVALKALYPTTLGGPDHLNGGDQLLQNQLIRSQDGRFIVVMQGDGNLVLYYYNVALWHTGTHGNPNINRAVMQHDGNLVLYDTGNVPRWSSGTHMFPGAFAVIQNDGNFVIYQSGIARWASNTSGY